MVLALYFDQLHTLVEGLGLDWIGPQRVSGPQLWAYQIDDHL